MFDPTTVLAGGQAVLGAIQMISGEAKQKKLLQQRSAYKTPEEYFKILQATQQLAQQGYDPFTLQYLTTQTDRVFSEAADTAARLGANPNDLSALFDQKINQIMKIGAENHALNMANFSKYLTALDVIGQNKAAEWKSQQDIIKDKLQAAGFDKQAGFQNLLNAGNAFISVFANEQTKKLFTEKKTTKTSTGTVSNPPVGGLASDQLPTNVIY